MATIGAVTYPTLDTWLAEASGIAPGVTTFTASDGSDTVAVSVVEPFITIRHRATGIEVPFKHSASGVTTPVKLS